ncbi:SigB/SigF/SigG family RNA polymerase sigma factor [Streptomyces sp. NPDC059740]|uniref:SigB/SigF/SigG family RNA polymerase sigma factor n=1 Tax=Streptomyces sp. NPDC059740 TaxID=3346926 RepID=UPI00364D4263
MTSAVATRSRQPTRRKQDTSHPQGPARQDAAPRAPQRSPHPDTPDTAEDFARLLTLPEGAEREAVRQGVITAWLPMADRLATRFRDRGENLEDLKQVAALGLVKAVDRYDPERADAFATFAVPTIVGELKRHFRDNTWGVHVPRRVQEVRAKVRTALRELSVSLDHRSPSVAQVAAHTGLSEDDVLLGLEALESYKSLSLDAELSDDDDGYSLKDRLGTLEPGFGLINDREAVKPQLARLPERERHILYLRFFCDMTQTRIADELGISQMHVCRLIARTCTRIREELGTAPEPADSPEPHPEQDHPEPEQERTAA